MVGHQIYVNIYFKINDIERFCYTDAADIVSVSD